MIKLEETDVYGFEAAIRGMRNPKNSWDKSDSHWCDCQDCAMVMCGDEPGIECNDGVLAYCIGKNDLKLMKVLAGAGTDHGKFLRMINVTVDITAPLYWWKEFDTYKVGTVANSCSTMHKIHAKEFTAEDFSLDHLLAENAVYFGKTLERLNHARKQFLETNDKEYWWQMIQLLPTSYNQKRTVQLNYAVLLNMYHARKNHKLDEWHEFCKWIESSPYFAEICLE